MTADRDAHATQPITSLSRRELGVGHACLVVIRGGELGARADLVDVDLVIGRAPGCGFRLDDPGVSRQHCRIWRDGDGWRLRDLGSTNKSFVNGAPVDEVELRDGDRIGIGETVFKFVRAGSVEERYHQQLYELASIDALTGLYNRRKFRELLEQSLLKTIESDEPLALVFIDLDHFKRINDTHGHQTGDEVLRGVAELVLGRLREGDAGGRLGGEEFAVFLPGTTLALALEWAEGLRAAIAAARHRIDALELAVTASLGVADWRPERPTSVELMRAADEQLYAAKAAGRDRVASGDRTPRGEHAPLR
jgi:diguanylate cyclase (GGDEF)-like protein